MTDQTTASEPPSSDALLGLREKTGDTIGPYSLLQVLGQGGFGTVFLAEQRVPVQRRVALKIIKLGMDTHAVIARFEAERQALAIMDHPNIAKVLDAGATGSGRPYFVMELVQGQPITAYCDRSTLPIESRLELFAQVCSAVQHAHTKGIIHRDIKPSNILVSEQDGRPFARVIDFGIAKATATRLTDKTLFTQQRQIIGTPEYMSPEQAEASLDIDTRTDVYSLGVLLYELLTGSTPFSETTLRSAADDEIRRIIREVDPPRPSTRIGKSTDTLAGVAAVRRIDPARLRTAVRGELDWIVMKALEKDRTRRYETANGLGMDVRRYLAGDAVLAAPPSRAYRARKFIRRHRVPVTAAALVLLTLVLGLVGTAYGLRQEALATRRATLEAERAGKAEAAANARAQELDTVASFQTSMLSQVDPTKAGKELTADVNAKFAAALAAVTPAVPEADRPGMIERFSSDWDRVNATDAARELIDRTILKPAVAAIDEQFKDQPVIDARLRQVLAERYMDLGLYDSALPLLTSALETRRRVLGNDDLATVNSVEHMGMLFINLGKPAEAEPFYREALETRRRVQGPDDDEVVNASNNLGDVYRTLGRLAEAEPLLEWVLESQRKRLGNEHFYTLASMNTLGQVYIRQDKPDRTYPLWREAYETGRRVMGEDDPRVLVFANNFAMVNAELGRFAEAEAVRADLLARARRIWGDEHPDTLTMMNGMGLVLQQQGKLKEAEPLYRECLEKRRRVLGEIHPSTLLSIHRLGALLQEQGKPAEAEPLLREALERRRRAFPANHRDIQDTLLALAQLLDTTDRPAESEALWRDLLNARLATNPKGAPRIAAAQFGLAGPLMAQKKLADAEPLLIEAFDAFSASKDFPRAPRDLLRESAQRLVTLYSSLDAADPGKGHDAKSAAWKSRLDAIPPPPAPK